MLAELEAYDAGTVAAAAGVTVAVVVLLRPLWILVASRLPAGLHARLGGDPEQGRPPLSGGEILALSWAGTRGVITLAAAFSLPAGFPGRDLLLFCAYLVVLVTLLGQGLTFAPLLRLLRLAGADVSEALTRNEARSAAVTAALARLTELQHGEPGLADIITPLRRAMEARLQRYSNRLALLAAAEEEDTLPVDDRYIAAVRVRREMLTAERDELVAWRDAGRLPDASLRTLQRELDHQESLLPPVPDS